MNWLEKLFGCKTCDVYKEQLEYERAVNKELVETVTSLIKPVPTISVTGTNPQLAYKAQVIPSRRRAELERIDRETARIRANSPVIAKSDDQIEQDKVIAKLEEELALTEVKETENANDSNVNG